MDLRATPSGPRSDHASATPRPVADVRDVTDRFEVFVSERSLAWLPRIRPESELPYPKAVVQAALRAARAAAQDDSEWARWTSCLVELEYFLPDRELEPYWAALDHERECIRLMGRANLHHALDRSDGLTPELKASYERHGRARPRFVPFGIRSPLPWGVWLRSSTEAESLLSERPNELRRLAPLVRLVSEVSISPTLCSTRP